MIEPNRNNCIFSHAAVLRVHLREYLQLAAVVVVVYLVAVEAVKESDDGHGNSRGRDVDDRKVLPEPHHIHANV